MSGRASQSSVRWRVDSSVAGVSASRSDGRVNASADLPLPNQERLERMRGQIPAIQIGTELDLGDEWRKIRDEILLFKQQTS